MTVCAIRLCACVNNFGYKTAEINIEEKHLQKLFMFFMTISVA